VLSTYTRIYGLTNAVESRGALDIQAVPFKLDVIMIIYRNSDNLGDFSLEGKYLSANCLLRQPTSLSTCRFVQPGYCLDFRRLLSNITRYNLSTIQRTAG
jgi:hypothetical protein